jgi:archaellum biogenesis protein FlaJ (TadC family)
MRLHTRHVQEEKEQDVKQMDAVINGLVAGGTTSILLIVAGVVVVFSDSLERLNKPSIIIGSIFVLSALSIGQLVLSSFLISAFAAAPSQTDKGVAV